MNNESSFWKYTRLPRVACLAVALTSAAAWAESPEPAQQKYFHGFASVGFIDTTGNNFYGDTRNGGEFDYYELGLNGFAQLLPNLSISGQILSRKAGATDEGKLRLDYGFLDLKVLNQDTSSAGIRVGRVRNPMGFYNESRDVVFTRPSILLPQSTYLEGTGIRELIFSSDGAQLYGDWDHDTSHTSLRLTLALDQHVSGQTKKNLIGDSPPPLDAANVKLRSPIFAQILHEMDGGRERFAFSYVDAMLTGDIVPINAPASLAARFYILSAQYNAENWSLTSEYTLSSSTYEILGMTNRNHSDGIYLQYQYRFSPEWTGLLRRDLSYPDRSNRGDNVSRDTTLGLRWLPDPDWLVSGEFHRIRGTGGIPSADNEGMVLSPNTNLLALMLGYRF